MLSLAVSHPVLLPSLLALASSLALRFSRIDLKSRAKQALGRLVHPRAAARWRAFVQADPLLRAHAQRQPSLLYRIHRPYLSRRLDCMARVDALIGHYREIQRIGLDALTQAAARADIELAGVGCKSGATAQLLLGALRDGHREGELSLKLQHAGQTIFEASLLLMPSPRGGRPALMLGRLQGRAGGREAVREATQDLHGCRPADFTIAVARHLAERLGCAELRLISNANRVALNWRRRRRISADYDKLWRELGAAQDADGDFRIAPLAAPDFDPMQHPSRKRAQARLRLALQQAVFEDLARSLAAWHPEKETPGAWLLLCHHAPETSRSATAHCCGEETVADRARNITPKP